MKWWTSYVRMDCYIDSKFVKDVNLNEHLGSNTNNMVTFCNRKYSVDLGWQGEGWSSLWNDLKNMAFDSGFKFFCNRAIEQKKVDPKLYILTYHHQHLRQKHN